MFKKLKELFTQYSKPEINPAIFEHPLALKTEWTPKKNGGSNIKTRKLVKIDRNRIELKPTNWAIFFSCFFMIIPVIFVFFVFRDKGHSNFSDFLFLLVPLIFLAVGGYSLFTTLRPIGFDKKLGYFFNSYKKPASTREIKNDNNWMRLQDIKALQIIAERVKTKNSNYTSYELNLINALGKRYNVIDHSSYKTIKDNSKQLADFLGVPYWDAVASTFYTPENITTEIQPEYGDVEDIIDDVDILEPQDTDKPYNSLKRRKM